MVTKNIIINLKARNVAGGGSVLSYESLHPRVASLLQPFVAHQPIGADVRQDTDDYTDNCNCGDVRSSAYRK